MNAQLHEATSPFASLNARRLETSITREGVSAAVDSLGIRAPRLPNSGVIDQVVSPMPVMARAGRARSFPERMRQLTDAKGGLATIARRCGFSQGAIRSWRDGRSDISRERCVVLSRTLGISLIWLLIGEGTMEVEAHGDRSSHTSSPSNESNQIEAPKALVAARKAVLDPDLLAAALRLLQSYIGCLGGSLNTVNRANLLVELYEILAQVNEPEHVDRLIAFHVKLSSMLRRNPLIVV